MGHLQRAAERLDTLNRGVGLAVRWLVLGMLGVQFGAVVLRYVFGVSSIALDESVLYFHAALFMLGAGYTLLVDAHVRIDILHARLSERTRAGVEAFGHLVLLMPFLLALLWWSWPTVRRSWAIWEGPLSVGGLPLVWLMKALIPAFCVLLLVQSLAGLLRALARLSERP
ncbi:MAG: TRAP transporter small permease subunit [Pseudomonadota bacterium]